MITKLRAMLLAAAISLALLFGSVAVTPVMAQDVEDPVTTEEEDDGFDWGLLGLLGLAGLAGLMKRPERDVRTVDRTGTTRP